ncbi:outer membrane beta-barrel protein [Natronoflexus pectinivorans]|nr:outer membrane beta-barrel protein [Natronoflexus pectinivorans]
MNRKIGILVIAILVSVTSAFSQSELYKPFKVDVGFLYASPMGGDDVSGGIGFYIEPKYNYTDNIALGLKLEWAILGSSDVEGMDVSVSGIGTYQLTGDYYFNTNRVRPFAGLGVGLYSLGSVDFKADVNDPNDIWGDELGMSLDYGTKFGFAPRVGVVLGSFRVGMEYNVITGIDSALESRNYLSFKFGFEIGGGKK